MSAPESDSDSSEIKSTRIPYVNLYRLDKEKCQKTFKKTSFDDIVECHAKSVIKKPHSTETDNPPSQHIRKVTRKIFTSEQKVQTRTQRDAGLKKIENAFSVWYLESDDGNIYVAAEGRSHHYFRHLSDHEFPEMVFDRHLDENVLEVHGQGLLGRVALYSEQYRQVHRIMDNLWQNLNSLTTKVKVPIRPDSELGKHLTLDLKTKVFVTVNFQNHSVQIRKALREIVPTLDVLIDSFARPSPGRCGLLRLVSRVHDDSMHQMLNKQLNEFLESAETHPEDAASSIVTEINSVALHTLGDEWNRSTVIRLELPTQERQTVKSSRHNACKAIKQKRIPPEDIRVCWKGEDGKEKVVSGRDYLEEDDQKIPVEIVYLKEGDKSSTGLTHNRHQELSSALIGKLHKKFKEKCEHFDFLFWLEKVVVKYSKNMKKHLPSLLECRQQFLLENKSHMFFHGEWLSFNPQFHSLLEVHFLELMKTRSIESNLILPLPWLNSGPDHSQKFKFGKFLAAWLRRSKVPQKTLEDLKTNGAYKQLKENLESSEMTELEYNLMYVLVDKLMESPKHGDQRMEAQATHSPDCQVNKGRGFLVADGVTVEGQIELFDVMYYDKVNVFFIHIKKGFNAKQMRHVVDQVRRSAEYIQCLLLKGRGALEEDMRKFIRSLWQCKKRKDEREDDREAGDKTGSDNQDNQKRNEKEEGVKKVGGKKGGREGDDREGDERKGKGKRLKRVDDEEGHGAEGDSREGAERQGGIRKEGKMKWNKKGGDKKTTVKKKSKPKPFKASCQCDEKYKWACDLDKRSARKFNGETFAELLISHRLHFVLAYGGRGMEDKGLHAIEGDEIKDALRKHEHLLSKLEENGYVKCSHEEKEASSEEKEEDEPPAAKKAKMDVDSYALTRRFCLVEWEVFLQDMTHQTSAEEAELENLFKDLKAAISTTDFNVTKMAFLNVFESFKNYKDMSLWFCRITHRCPEWEEIEEITACLENMDLLSQG